MKIITEISFYLLYCLLFFALFHSPFYFPTLLQWTVKQRWASHISWAPSSSIVPCSYVFFISSFLVVCLPFVPIPFFSPSFFIQPRRNKRNSFCRWQHLYVSISKDFSLKQVEDRRREVNFSISHHKNSILLILQKHFSILTRTCSLFLFCGSFISALSTHGTGRKMDVNSNRNMENFSFRSAESAIISHRYQPSSQAGGRRCSCAGHEVIWGTGGITPLILNLGTGCRWVVS